MAELNATLQFLTPYFSEVEGLIGAVSVLVGGIFGIYLIAVAIRLVMLHRMFKSYKEIKVELKQINEKIDELSRKRR